MLASVGEPLIVPTGFRWIAWASIWDVVSEGGREETRAPHFWDWDWDWDFVLMGLEATVSEPGYE